MRRMISCTSGLNIITTKKAVMMAMPHRTNRGTGLTAMTASLPEIPGSRRLGEI
jgi:hypothetical protein